MAMNIPDLQYVTAQRNRSLGKWQRVVCPSRISSLISSAVGISCSLGQTLQTCMNILGTLWASRRQTAWIVSWCIHIRSTCLQHAWRRRERECVYGHAHKCIHAYSSVYTSVQRIHAFIELLESKHTCNNLLVWMYAEQGERECVLLIWI
jgi:hypothetical protein